MRIYNPRGRRTSGFLDIEVPENMSDAEARHVINEAVEKGLRKNIRHATFVVVLNAFVAIVNAAILGLNVALDAPLLWPIGLLGIGAGYLGMMSGLRVRAGWVGARSHWREVVAQYDATRVPESGA